ncbi:SpoIID/LytB domain-containing protein [Chamaesiphon sp. VAR_48_metabat_135_sub]|uniref:SpoIID/LytB domain-containing protein n=1 Tax=Chamaesiphon sp. VAR_48_metabat_135_sub TaxID=2964699 RepID=UPI00286BBFFB|nr:SpoIID/LytB domain-containing protein [Chamaesiphon sp. VAR_48_metabat_135_sub]
MLIRILQLGKQTGWFSLLLWSIAIAPAQASQLRVAVSQKISQVNIGSSTIAIVSDDKGRKIGELQPQKGLVAQVSNDEIQFGDTNVAQLWVKPQQGGYVWIGVGEASQNGGRWYRGSVQVISTGKQLLAINHVDLEQYLYSVLGAEMSPTFPAEALKAQAVAARTYALYRSQSTRQKPFDVDSTQASQVYRGLSSEANTTQAAVKATVGQIVMYGGKPILAAFHSASGGHTENVEDIWSSRVPYLRGVPDYDLGTPGYEWSKTFSNSELSQSLKVDNIKAIAPDRFTQFGSVVSLKVLGDTENTFTGAQVRTMLKLRSIRFTITPTPEGFIFNGRGYGHALGLSQWGAYNLAQKGMKYPSILAHYYQGVELGRVGN